MHTLKRVAKVTGYVLLALVATAVVAVLSVFTPPGRRVVRDVANRELASLFRGQLRIGEVTELRWGGRLVATGVTLRDPHGRLVADGGVLEASPVSALLPALWRGLHHRAGAEMPRIALHLRTVRLVPDAQGVPSFADALALRNPAPPPHGPPAPSPTLRFGSLDVAIDRVESTLGGVAASASDVRAHGSLDLEPLALVVDSAHARVESARSAPADLRASFAWHSRFQYSPPRWTAMDNGSMRGAVDVESAELACHAELTRDGATLHAAVSGCRATADALTRAAGQPVAFGVEISTANATQSGDGPWLLEAHAAAGGQPIDARATVGVSDAVLDVTTRGLALQRLEPTLPTTDVTGTVHLERHGTRLALDTSRLRAEVAGVEVPPLRATLDVVGRRVTLDSLEARSIGLVARGETDLDHPLDATRAEVHLHTRNGAAVAAIGHARARGALDLDATLASRAGRVTARVDGSARNFRGLGARIGQADLHARADGTVQGGAVASTVEGSLRARGVVAGGFGPLAIDATTRGDPLRSLEGTLRVDGTSPLPPGPGVPRGAVARTAFSGPYAVRIAPDAITVRLPRAALALRGAEGTASGEVRVPRTRGGELSVHASVTTREGGRAELSLHGADVRGRFEHFPVAWVARAAGTTLPLGGTVDGDLDLLTARSASPRGTLRWHNGRLPCVGPFELAITADHAGRVAVFHAQLDAGPARDAHLVADVRALPPASLGDARGWLRGLRDARVEARGVPLRDLEPLAPPGTRIGGHLDARLLAAHAEADAPIEITLGIDARNAQLGRDAGVRVPDALRRVVAASDIRALTAALRVRGAVCARVRPSTPLTTPLALDVALGREVGEPDADLPTQCPDAAPTAPLVALVREPLVQARASLDGPWIAAATAYATALERRGTPHFTNAARRALAAAHARARVELGPVSTDRWPFSRAVATLSRALARPALSGSAHVTLLADGAFDRPTLDLAVDAHARDVAPIAARNDANASLRVRVAPAHDGTALLDDAQLTADVSGGLSVRDGAQPSTATVAGHADVRAKLAWLLDPRETRRAIEREDVRFEARGLRLGWLRWARARGVDGVLDVAAHHDGDPAVLAVVQGSVAQLRANGARTPLGIAFSASARTDPGSGWHALACVDARPGTGAPPACTPDASATTAPPGGLVARVDVPFAGNITALAPRLEGVTATLVANGLRLEPLSPFAATPPIERIGGALSARLDWRGRSPREVRGEVHVADGLVWIEGAPPAQRVVLDVSGDGRRVEVRRLALAMGSGTLAVHGALDVDPTGTEVARARLALEARRLPIEVEGNPYGAVTTRGEFSATAWADRLEGRVLLHGAQVQLPTEVAHMVQDLAPDPHVRVVRNGRLVSVGDATASPTAFPIDLDVDSDAPITALRNDLQVTVRARLHVHDDAAGVALQGGVHLALAQSWFELLGKRFYIDRALIRLDGATVVDPIVDIAAHYDSPSAGRIDITVGGRVSRPRFAFVSESDPDADSNQVLALLVLGRQDARGAGDQQAITQQAGGAIAGLLTSVTAGALTNAARQRFDFLPRVIADPGSEGLGSGRYGAGATTLNGRLYVEGTYGAAASYGGVLDPVAAQQSGANQEFHGLVEYSLSPRWSVSGQYGTSNRFGADVYWTPLR